MNASEQFVAQMREAERLLCRENSLGPVQSYAGFFTEHAVPMEKIGMKLPKGARRGKMGNCYCNATRLADRYDLIYCEGYAVSVNVPYLPLLHGWCLHPETLEVIDPTWKDGSGYYGVAYTHGWVRKVALDTLVFGIIDNWQGHDDLRGQMMSGKITPDVWKHPVMQKFQPQPQPQIQ